MAYRTLNFRITGESPLVMHSGQLANPLNRFAKALKQISAKRKKTDADYEEIARIEFLGSLYLKGGKPCIPGEVIESCLIKGARSRKRGEAAKAGVLCLNASELNYVGPTDPNELWKDESFRLAALVKVGTARIVRTRPIFNAWSADVEVKYNPSLVNENEIVEWFQIAGEEKGIGDWRPRFGRFGVAKLN